MKLLKKIPRLSFSQLKALSIVATLNIVLLATCLMTEGDASPIFILAIINAYTIINVVIHYKLKRREDHESYARVS